MSPSTLDAVRDRDNWTADPNWRRRLTYIGLGLWFAALLAVGLAVVWLGRHDTAPWVR